LLRSPRNGGFGAGCNLGIAGALARWPGLEPVLLLHPDAELRDGALAALQATQRRRGAGIVGCRIDDADGRPWFENGRIPRWTLAGFHTTADPLGEHATEFVTGACMLLDANLLRRGLRFDEGFFLYCEDADLCEQARALGATVWLAADARATHVGGGSQPGALVLGELTASRMYWLTRAKALFAGKRLTLPQRASFWFVALALKPLAGVAISRSLRFLPHYLRGLRDGWRAAAALSRPR
jgi:GT2 family glycosyltransferase